MNFWKTKSYLNMSKKKSQLSFYKENNSSKEILSLVDKESKSFGTILENMIVEYFSLSKRINPQHDGILYNKKIEIKSARYWCCTTDCMWQHLEKDYDYDVCIFVLVEFSDIKTWVISKQKLFSKHLIDKKIMRKQGKQGHIVKKSLLIDYLTEVNSYDDLIIYLQKL